MNSKVKYVDNPDLPVGIAESLLESVNVERVMDHCNNSEAISSPEIKKNHTLVSAN